MKDFFNFSNSCSVVSSSSSSLKRFAAQLNAFNEPQTFLSKIVIFSFLSFFNVFAISSSSLVYHDCNLDFITVNPAAKLPINPLDSSISSPNHSPALSVIKPNASCIFGLPAIAPFIKPARGPPANEADPTFNAVFQSYFPDFPDLLDFEPVVVLSASPIPAFSPYFSDKSEEVSYIGFPFSSVITLPFSSVINLPFPKNSEIVFSFSLDLNIFMNPFAILPPRYFTLSPKVTSSTSLPNAFAAPDLLNGLVNPCTKSLLIIFSNTVGDCMSINASLDISVSFASL